MHIRILIQGLIFEGEKAELFFFFSSYFITNIKIKFTTFYKNLVFSSVPK